MLSLALALALALVAVAAAAAHALALALVLALALAAAAAAAAVAACSPPALHRTTCPSALQLALLPLAAAAPTGLLRLRRLRLPGLDEPDGSLSERAARVPGALLPGL